MGSDNNHSRKDPYNRPQRSDSNSHSPPPSLEDQEAELKDILARTKDTRFQSRDLTRDALSRLRETQSVAERTMVQLDSQSERIERAGRDLDLASQHGKVAEQQVKDLKRANKFLSFRNPFRKDRERKLAKMQVESTVDEHSFGVREERRRERVQVRPFT
jgi:hypothetical protein